MTPERAVPKLINESEVNEVLYCSLGHNSFVFPNVPLFSSIGCIAQPTLVEICEQTIFIPFKRQNKRCTVAQKKALVDYMSTHTYLARYECDAATANVEWQRLAKTLNRSGTVKTVQAWKHTWRDIRRKAARDEEEARATNASISDISGKIREIMADSDEDLIGMPGNNRLSPTSSISVHSPAEESDQDQEETIDLPQVQSIQTMEVPAEDMETRPLSPVSELESLQGPPESSSDSSPCTSPTPMNKARCTQDQINTLVDCMAINTSMAFGRQNTPKKAEDWRRLRQFLNKMGPVKRTVAWQKTWRDLKRGAVVSEKAKPVWIRPTTKKILDIIEAYTKKVKDNPREVSADDELFLPPEPSVHRAPSILPPSEYVILPDADRSKMRDGKHDKVSPARRSSSIMSSLHNSSLESPASFVLSENEHDSDDDSRRSQGSNKVKKMRCTNAQKYAIVDYMARHPGLATSRASDGDSYYAEWRQLSKYVNKIGTAKTTASWKRTWRELKKNARCNRSSNHKWGEVNERILEICAISATVKRQAKSGIGTAVEDVKPCPNDDMPPLSFRKQSSHSPHTPPKIVLCEENQSNDMTEPNHDLDRQSNQSSEVSPELRNSVSSQCSEPSPARTKKEPSQQSESPKSKNTRCTPAQIHALMNYLAKHPSLAKAKCLYVPKGRDPWYSEWRRLTRYLNSLNKMGPAKSTTGWKNTWRTLCLNARRKKSKQCPSYESVYKKVLKILGEERVNENGPALGKVETIEDNDSLPTQTGSNQAYSQSHSEHRMSDPLQCEKDRSDVYKDNQDYRNHTVSSRHTSRQVTDEMSLQRGSRMSPVRISDKVSPARRSDGMSPGRSSEISVPRLSRTPPVLDGDHDNLVDSENELNRWGKPRKVRSSNGQLRALADYMIDHPELATDKYIDHREPAWLRLAKHLNDIGPARKRTEAWKRTWRDIKNGVRARGRSNQRSGSLESFREERVLKLIGISSPDRKNNAGSDDDHMDEDYLVPEPEVILTPRAPSPHSQYNLTEILARSSPIEDQSEDNVPSEDPCVATTTNSLLKTLLQEVRRSNELSVQHNSYLKEILKQLRTQKCMHGTRHADRDSPINHGNNAQEQKQEVLENTLEVLLEDSSAGHCNEVNDSHEIPVNPPPLIRPVSLSSLTTSSTPKPTYEQMKVQSILQGKVKPATPKGKLIRLKDGTMVLVPENMKTKAGPNHEKNGESQIDDQKMEINKTDS